MFDMPNKLPPNRGFKHAIVLKEGATPMSVRPYRYPQIQKTEIELLVSKMLVAGVIQPSRAHSQVLYCWLRRKTAIGVSV